MDEKLTLDELIEKLIELRDSQEGWLSTNVWDIEVESTRAERSIELIGEGL